MEEDNVNLDSWEDIPSEQFRGPEQREQRTVLTTFTYPPNTFKGRTFKTLENIKQAFQDNSNHRYCQQNSSYGQQKKIYLRCRVKGCRSTITYLYEPEADHYRIVKMKNFHTHNLCTNKRLQEKAVLAQMKKNGQYILKKNVHYQYLKQKFGVKYSRFCYLQKKLRDKQQTMYKQFLEQNKYIYQEYKGMYGDGQFPQILILTDVSMQKNYKKFGDCLKFDILYAAFKIKSMENAVWNVGLLTGFNQNNCPVIFAITFSCNKDTESYENIFSCFFRLMGGKSPETFITGLQPGVVPAVQKLRDTGVYTSQHLFDQWDFMRHCLKKVIDTEQLNDTKDRLKIILTSRNESVINENLQALRARNESRILDLFQQYKYKVTTYHCPKSFYGVSLTSSACEIFLAVSKRIKPNGRALTFDQVVQTLLLANKRLVSKGVKVSRDKSVSLGHGDECLSEVQSSICEKIFLKFYTQYLAASKLKGKREDSKFVFSDKYRVEKGGCSCCYRMTSGLPCCHEIYAAFELRMPLIGMIRDRWKLDKPFDQLKQGKRVESKDKLGKMALEDELENLQ